METRMQVPQGVFELYRLPANANSSLRAWDAADEYLLNYLAEQNIAPQSTVLILNDNFGALSLALHDFNPLALSDSCLSQQATSENLSRNQINPAHVQLQHSLFVPEHNIDTLIIKVPKTLALLEFQLMQLKPRLTESSQVILAGMVKNLPKTLWTLLQRLVGETDTHLAWKKARLISVQVNPHIKLPANPYPVKFALQDSPYTLSNHANLFSRDRLDIGARFFLQHLPINPTADKIIDLGCGNGVLGIMLAAQHPHAKLCFIDESYMAICSARENFQRAFPDQDNVSFLQNDCLSGITANSADLIVCNPPFHQQHAVGDQIARQMFQQSRAVLKTGGELKIVGNRHLNYHVLLKQLFGHCDLVASNRKFVVLKCVNK